MTLNEKFGRGDSNSSKLTINNAPDMDLLRRLLNDLSDATSVARCDVSWKTGDHFFTLTITHSRMSARAEWKLYHRKGDQSDLIWSHATNDLYAVHKQVTETHQQVKSTQTQSGLSALRRNENNSEERRAITNTVSGKLRKLFVGAREDKMAQNKSSSSPLLPSQSLAKAEIANKRVIEFIDITPGRQMLQNLFMGEFGVFSSSTFFFFLEREYNEAVENKMPVTLVLFEATDANGQKEINTSLLPVLQEIAKRVKHTQRKTDVLAQYKDGKFAVLLPDTNAAGAKTFIDRVEKTLFKTALLPGLGDASIKVTFGISTLGEHCKSLSAFLFYAEKALEKAQSLGEKMFSDLELLAERKFDEQEINSIDLTPARQLISQLVSKGIFTYSAFLAFLEQEYYLALRKEKDLLIMLVKIRINEETFDEPTNFLPPPISYEVMRRIGSLLNKSDIFAHYINGNFIIMRPNSSLTQTENLAKRFDQNIKAEDWLTADYPAASLRTRMQICVATTHPTATNLFCFVQPN